MTPALALLYLRFVELAVIIAACWWVVWTQPPCPYRTKRLAIAFVIVALNVAAILVCTLWLGVSPW